MAKWNKSETLLLLTLYEKNPFLYKPNDPNYMNKFLRRQKLHEICEELKKVKSDVTVEDIKLKIKTLRSQLRKEKKIISDSKKNASSSDAVYVPSLWSYRHIQFLEDSIDDEPIDVSTNEPSETSEFFSCERYVEEVEALEDSSESNFNHTAEMPVKRKHTDNFKEEAKNAFEFAKSFAEDILQNRAKRKPETKEEIFTKYLCERLKLFHSEDIYEDTTWKILQAVREGLREDRYEREEFNNFDLVSEGTTRNKNNRKVRSFPRGKYY